MLLERGIPVVDQDMVRANLQKDQTLMKMAGENRSAAALGLQYGAEVMIVGDAVAKPAARRIGDSNLRSYQAVVTLRAVRTDDSETMASASEDATVIALDDVSGSSKALKLAGDKSLQALLPAMLMKWEGATPGGGAAGGGRVQLAVGGVDKAWKVKAVREKLGMLPGVTSVTQRSYTAGAAVFELEIRSSAQEFAEQFVLEAPPGLKLQILSVGTTKIELRAAADES
jgi:hypothetical protein